MLQYICSYMFSCTPDAVCFSSCIHVAVTVEQNLNNICKYIKKCSQRTHMNTHASARVNSRTHAHQKDFSFSWNFNDQNFVSHELSSQKNTCVRLNVCSGLMLSRLVKDLDLNVSLCPPCYLMWQLFCIVYWCYKCKCSALHCLSGCCLVVPASCDLRELCTSPLAIRAMQKDQYRDRQKLNIFERHTVR